MRTLASKQPQPPTRTEFSLARHAACDEVKCAARAGVASDFSGIPARTGNAVSSYSALEPEEGPGPVSQGDAGPRDAGPEDAGPRDAGPRDAGPRDAGPRDAGPRDAGVPPPPCAITTRTLAGAPDGTANTRKTVGPNERVQMTASAAATWTASAGVVAPATGTTTIWTAPDAGGPSTVTATPASGAPCSVAMQVNPPTSRVLIKTSNRAYSAGKAGSGFVANGTLAPKNVSFSRIEVMEGTVAAVATGYYDTVLHWNGIMHPPTASWLAINASNGGFTDTVGSPPPGTPGPFSAGNFLWAIPQLYRSVGNTGTGTPFNPGNHVQNMADATGVETTLKEGAKGGPRTP
jgi:hypothetical protein